MSRSAAFSTVLQLVTGCVGQLRRIGRHRHRRSARDRAPGFSRRAPHLGEDARDRDVPRQGYDAASSAACSRPACGSGAASPSGGSPTAARFASSADRLLFAHACGSSCFGALQRFLGLNRVRNGFCGGATISTEVLLFFWTLGVPVYQIYGMTESAGVCFAQRPGATRLGLRRPADRRRRTSPRRRTANCCVRAPSIFKGYLFDEAATARAVEDGWLAHRRRRRDRRTTAKFASSTARRTFSSPPAARTSRRR